MGKKIGMTTVFDEQGNIQPCTVIQVEPNVVMQIKTQENDGYEAVKLAHEVIKSKNPQKIQAKIGKPLVADFSKRKLDPRRRSKESRISVEGLEVGQEFGVDFFAEEKHIDIQAESKGKGYQGLMKLHNFKGGPAAHGSGFHRHAGSTGMRSTPGRCFPGSPRASRMGGNTHTYQSLKIIDVKKDQNLLLVKGSVPGAKNGIVLLSKALKKGK